MKLGYGTGDLSSSIFFTVGTFLLLNFLTDTVGLNAALAGLFCGLVLSYSSYIEPINGTTSLAQPESALLGIRLLIGPGSAIFFLIGNIVHSFYPIDKKMYDEIQEKIKNIESEKR